MSPIIITIKSELHLASARVNRGKQNGYTNKHLTSPATVAFYGQLLLRTFSSLKLCLSASSVQKLKNNQGPHYSLSWNLFTSSWGIQLLFSDNARSAIKLKACIQAPKTLALVVNNNCSRMMTQLHACIMQY